MHLSYIKKIKDAFGTKLTISSQLTRISVGIKPHTEFGRDILKEQLQRSSYGEFHRMQGSTKLNSTDVQIQKKSRVKYSSGMLQTLRVSQLQSAESYKYATKCTVLKKQLVANAAQQFLKKSFRSFTLKPCFPGTIESKIKSISRALFFI